MLYPLSYGRRMITRLFGHGPNSSLTDIRLIWSYWTLHELAPENRSGEPKYVGWTEGIEPSPPGPQPSVLTITLRPPRLTNASIGLTDGQFRFIRISIVNVSLAFRTKSGDTTCSASRILVIALIM